PVTSEYAIGQLMRLAWSGAGSRQALHVEEEPDERGARRYERGPEAQPRREEREAEQDDHVEREDAGEQRPPGPHVATAIRPEHDRQEQHGVGARAPGR